MEKLTFKLEVYEGPLDLLLQLIHKNKVSIYDIPIAQITDQYLAEVERMQEMELEVSSEFIIMAAQLLYIKSRMLLPAAAKEEGEEDPRSELTEHLLAYQRDKTASAFLKEREFSSRYLFFKEPESIEPAVAPDDKTYCIEDLTRAFYDILERSQRRAPPPQKNFEGIVRRTVVSVKVQIRYILHRVASESNLTFNSLFEAIDTREALVATFLGLLELIKEGRLTAEYRQAQRDFLLAAR